MASVIGRRPNGVVTFPLCIFFHLSKGNRKLLTKTMPRLLTMIRENAILDLARNLRKAFTTETFGGLFLLLLLSFFC
jgi:hypothetical protein